MQATIHEGQALSRKAKLKKNLARFTFQVLPRHDLVAENPYLLFQRTGRKVYATKISIGQEKKGFCEQWLTNSALLSSLVKRTIIEFYCRGWISARTVARIIKARRGAKA